MRDLVRQKSRTPHDRLPETREPEPSGPDRSHMLGIGVDKRDGVALLGERGADDAADGPSADDREFRHGSPHGAGERHVRAAAVRAAGNLEQRPGRPG